MENVGTIFKTFIYKTFIKFKRGQRLYKPSFHDDVLLLHTCYLSRL